MTKLEKAEMVLKVLGEMLSKYDPNDEPRKLRRDWELAFMEVEKIKGGRKNGK